MMNGIDAALSALNAFSKKVAVTSNNVANLNSDGYKKSRAVLQEGENGGVEASIRIIDAPGNPIPYEGDSDVDLAEEAVNMITARRGYEANIKSIEAQVELEETIVDILE